jgi:hypothetical protein
MCGSLVRLQHVGVQQQPKSGALEGPVLPGFTRRFSSPLCAIAFWQATPD